MTIFDVMPLETILDHFKISQLELQKRQLLRKDDQTFRETGQFLIIEHLEDGGSNIFMKANLERAFKIGAKFGFNFELLKTVDDYSMVNVNGPLFLNTCFGGPGTVVMISVREQTQTCSICNEKIENVERDTVNFYYGEKINPVIPQSCLRSKVRHLQKELEPGSEWRTQNSLPWVVGGLTPCAHIKDELQLLEH